MISGPHETFCKTDHTLRHRACLSRYKKIKIRLCILSNHHELKLDRNYNSKLTNSRKRNNSLLSEKWVRTEIKKEIKDFLEFNENKDTT